MDEPPRPNDEAPDDVVAPVAAEADVPPPPSEDEVAKKKRSFLTELPILLLIAFALAVIIKTFFLQAFFIPSESMEPTLHGCAGCSGDRVLVNKLVYHIHPPRRGDIVVFIEKHGERQSFWGHVRSVLFEGLGVTRPSDTDFIKRVIALPGETLKMDKGVVTITEPNGKSFALSEPYVKFVYTTPFGPFTVPAGRYFVMGDNRPNSADSRTSLGPIKGSDIVGRAFIRIWPPSRFGFLTRPHYPTAPRAFLPISDRPRARARAPSGAGAILPA